MNITLIGMAGAGKTFVGERLANRLGMEFLDVDSHIESLHGKRLEEILQDVGDDTFMQIEEEAIISTTSGKDNLVISAGGSIAYEEVAKKRLKTISKIVYLNVPLPVVTDRIGNSPSRLGQIVGLGSKSFEELFNERTPIYEEIADFRIDADRDADTIVDEIVQVFGND
jgi:shikimate kinase